jgi:hypothetical protein
MSGLKGSSWSPTCHTALHVHILSDLACLPSFVLRILNSSRGRALSLLVSDCATGHSPRVLRESKAIDTVSPVFYFLRRLLKESFCCFPISFPTWSCIVIIHLFSFFPTKEKRTKSLRSQLSFIVLDSNPTSHNSTWRSCAFNRFFFRFLYHNHVSDS